MKLRPVEITIRYWQFCVGIGLLILTGMALGWLLAK